jgi:hypothetical protein
MEDATRLNANAPQMRFINCGQANKLPAKKLGIKRKKFLTHCFTLISLITEATAVVLPDIFEVFFSILVVAGVVY